MLGGPNGQNTYIFLAGEKMESERKEELMLLCDFCDSIYSLWLTTYE